MPADSCILGNKKGHFGAMGHEATGCGGVFTRGMQCLSDAPEA